MKKIKAILIGAGQRGYEVYGKYALKHKDTVQFVAVVEPDEKRRQRFAGEHNISPDLCFENWDDIANRGNFADAVFICTQDRLHVKPTLTALRKGYHVLLEKPMATTADECLTMGEVAKRYDRIFAICHVLRYSNFFMKIKEILSAGTIGEIININLAENVSFWHQAHSFVRGNWNNSDITSPMILQKCCHDMDIISWLIEKKCRKVSSFGDLTHFKSKNAPEGSKERCTEDCAIKESCCFNAEKFYLGNDINWPVSVISTDLSVQGRRKAIETGKYGRCVYHCNNNVVDHQISIMEFENGITASLSMSAFTQNCYRSIHIMGTKGEIQADMNKFGNDAKRNEIICKDFLTGQTTIDRVDDNGLMTGHEGADTLLAKDFINLVSQDGGDSKSSADKSIESHLMSLAAEKSRKEQRTVFLDELWGNSRNRSAYSK